MEEVSSLQQLKDIYKALDEHKKLALFGKPGVGKTWMAKRVTGVSAMRHLCDLTLWVFMCRTYDKRSLSESFARQLSLVSTTEEWEVEDDSKGAKEDDEVEENLETLIEKIKQKLLGKKILLILDDVPDDSTQKEKNETAFWSVWEDMKLPPRGQEILLTISITRSNEENGVEVKPLPREASESLLIKNLDAQLNQSAKIKEIYQKLLEKGDALPGTVMMIAKALSYFGLDESGVLMMEKELEEASEKYDVGRLLCKKHNVLPISVLKDLCWRGCHFFRDSGSVHYSELITYWILEGYLGGGSMSKVYEKGHAVLIELMDCGLLKRQEGGYVFMDKSLLNANHLYQCVDQIACLGLATVFDADPVEFGRVTHEDGMLKTPRKGKKGQKQVVKEDEESQSQTPKNEEQKPYGEEGENLSTLLLDGSHFNEKVMMNFLKYEKRLEVLALFNPTIKLLPPPLKMMEKLRVLVLRGCDFLQEVKLPLKDLIVLEISGARSLKKLPSGFFNGMPKLRSLNLSQLQITSLPTSFYKLTTLRWLIVKDCRHLKKLESLSKLEELMAVDLSGNTSLQALDKNFLKFKNLQSLNLSNTMVTTTPLLKNLGDITHLLLRDCKDLGRLRGINQLTSLQTLDLSGSHIFEEFHDSSLASLRSLITLDLSGTALDHLPSNVADPRHFYLKGCLHLKQLSTIDSLKNLEVLDLSGSENLNTIDDDFFKLMSSLRVLNLSETNVTSLPSLSNLSNLRELLLSCCSSLVKLPSLEFVTNLEVLDASECTELTDIENPSFENLVHLQRLDLSETEIKSLPSLSNPSRLRHLLLQKCTKLNHLQLNISLSNLEELNLSGVTSVAPNGAGFLKDMSNLRFLDLSYTQIEQLPSMSKLTNLTHLSLAGCKQFQEISSLNPLTKLEILDLSQSSIKCLPPLTKFSNLRKLLLKDCSEVEGFRVVDVNDILFPSIPKIPLLEYLEFPNIEDTEKQNDVPWSICQLSDDNKPPLFLSGTQFLHVLKNPPSPESKVHLCALPMEIQSHQRLELIFGDIYFQNGQFPRYKENRLLQIRGFDQIPKGIENIINHVNLVYLIDDKFTSLLSVLSVSILNELKSCWIERCNEMVTVFDEKDTKDDPKIALENLGISNAPLLVSIYNGKQKLERFNNLEKLYLDCCPKLSTVFSSSWLPENLKVLQVKHCDKITVLCDSQSQLPKLETLHLWELPELETIGVSFPSLRMLKIWECPKFKKIENFEFAKGLKTLWISGAISLKSLLTGNQDREIFMNLETLKMEFCPVLENVFSSSLTLDEMKTIEIRSCENLRTLFVNSCSLPFLVTLRLEDLPLLKSIGTKLQYSENQNFDAKECPNLPALRQATID